MIEISEKDGAVSFLVRVIPRASRSELVGEHDGALKVKLASPPVDGAANAELIKLLAKKIGVAKSDVAVIAGETSRTKRIAVRNAGAEKINAVLHEKR